MPRLLEQIEAMFEAHGAEPQDTHAGEPVSALSHALQCAQLAEWADAPPSLVCAALLHDVGHFVPVATGTAAERLPHEQRALGVLADGFDEAVLGPIRLHVQAKRYLAATDPRYAERLSSRSRRALTVQGGPMTREQQRRFEQQPHAWGAVQLRRWDDRAKEPGKRTPPLAYYLGVLDDMLQAPDDSGKIAIGARGV